jgi:hypothetical protein
VLLLDEVGGEDRPLNTEDVVAVGGAYGASVDINVAGADGEVAGSLSSDWNGRFSFR